MKYAYHNFVIFDLDGTLCEPFTTEFLPGREAYFRQLPPNLKIAIATNQGGVGLRRWMEMDGFGDPEKFPAQTEVEERLDHVARQIAIWSNRSVYVYVSYRYQSKSGNWSPLPPEGIDEDGDCYSQWLSTWRKPGAGMLHQAMVDAEAIAEETLFVGDDETDRQAAEVAGVQFETVERYFERIKR